MTLLARQIGVFFYYIYMIFAFCSHKYEQDNGEKFTSLLTAISAYAEGFSADKVIRRALYLWKKLEKQ